MTKTRRRQNYSKHLYRAKAASARSAAELKAANRDKPTDGRCPHCGSQWYLHDCPGKRKEQA
jgi:hypothetical protein